MCRIPEYTVLVIGIGSPHQGPTLYLWQKKVWSSSARTILAKSLMPCHEVVISLSYAPLTCLLPSGRKGIVICLNLKVVQVHQGDVFVIKHPLVFTSASTTGFKAVTALLFVFQGCPDCLYVQAYHDSLPLWTAMACNFSLILPTVQLFLYLNNLLPWGSWSAQ